MAFVSVPDDTDSTPATGTPPAPVTNDGFFPDIDLTTIRDIARVPSAVTDARLRASVIAAIITVARDLDRWAAGKKAVGITRLADVPAVQIDRAPILVHLYHRAVAMFTKAELIERMRDFDTTGAGGKDIDELNGTADDMRRDGIYAIRDMLEQSRINVELI